MSSVEFGSVPGRRGATAASWKEKNPRVVVKHVMDQYPRAGVDEIVRRVSKALDTAEWSDYLDTFVEHTTRNCFAAIFADERRNVGHVKPSLRPAPAGVRQAPPEIVRTQTERETQRTEAVKKTAHVVDAIKRMCLMEMETPLGKVGDLDEPKCAKLGGWFGTIGKGIGKKSVRDVRTEADLQAAIKKLV